MNISVVVPCYNMERYVARTIQSILDQPGAVDLIVVVNDGSTDGSAREVAAFGNRIESLELPNGGACAARNAGLARTTSRYVMFLDADDYLEGPFLEAGVAAMDAAQADLGFGPCVVEQGAQRKRHEPHGMDAPAASFEALFDGTFFPPCATIWRRDFVERIGGWKTTQRRNQDAELIARALGHSPRIATWQRGNGVYFQHNAATRVSHKTDRATFDDQFGVLATIREAGLTLGLPTSRLDDIIRRRAYQLLLQAARQDNLDTYRHAKSAYRSTGGKGHLGSLPHRLASALLGLRGKERLSLMLRRSRRGA